MWKNLVEVLADGPVVALIVCLAWEHKKELDFYEKHSFFVQNKTKEIGYTNPDFHCAYEYS